MSRRSHVVTNSYDDTSGKNKQFWRKYTMKVEEILNSVNCKKGTWMIIYKRWSGRDGERTGKNQSDTDPFKVQKHKSDGRWRSTSVVHIEFMKWFLLRNLVSVLKQNQSIEISSVQIIASSRFVILRHLKNDTCTVNLCQNIIFSYDDLSSDVTDIW